MIHMKYGSSTAARTDACPGWQQESEGIPRSESGAATDGTITHGINEAWNLGDATPKMVDGHKVEADHLDMAEQMLAAQDAVFEQYSVIDMEPEVTGQGDADVGGTLDVIALTKDGRGMLLDYKTGRGVQVSAVGNKQILFAAATAMIDSCMKEELLACKSFIGVILQPNMSGEVQTKVWEFTKDEVNNFWEHHSAMIEVSRGEDALLKSGDHCRFCPAAPICPEKNGQAQAALRMEPDDLAILSENLGMVAELEQWIKAVRSAAHDQLEAGAVVTGYKLVPKRAVEKWADLEGALKAFRRRLGGKAGFYVEKPITPAEARKRLKAKGGDPALVSNYTEKSSSGYNVAESTDDRADISPAAIASAISAVA